MISGRPISFKMDLYNPLYVDRPIVEPELFASLRPVTYRGGFNVRTRSSDFRPKRESSMTRIDGITWPEWGDQLAAWAPGRRREAMQC